MKCSRCGFKLEDIDRKANKCPVCEKVIDPKRKDK
jgi:DNA-directed RNA polymerase subunit RPC12/RpoP